MTSGASDLVDVTVTLLRASPRAWLVKVDDGRGEDREVWLPKSETELEDQTPGEETVATVPRWLAREKGLVGETSDDKRQGRLL